VEDGLPRWHHGLRSKEYKAIDSKLTSEHVRYVPSTVIGKDVPLEELVADWGFHAVVLANGAWNDRRLPIEGAEQWVGRGLVYQNPFIYWFNHYNEATYSGEQYEILDGTLVVGGGLASIDVAKVINLELAKRALAERGIDQDLVEMEVAGIPKTLEKHGTSWEELGFEGATIFYRRREQDMPLVEMPEGADEKVQERIAKSRKRVLEKSQSKYLFKIQPLRAPTGLIIENDRVVGMQFAVTEVANGRVKSTDARVEARAPMIISSIGSVPREIEGIDMDGELYHYDDWEFGRMNRYPTLFSVGNVVTGKGNIVASRKHSRVVSKHVTEQYLELAQEVQKKTPLTDDARAKLIERVEARQKQVGYDGDYTAWIDAATPPDRV
jgi:NADPH-dependent glutamate synthase beta subunit-like oxidoreductase